VGIDIEYYNRSFKSVTHKYLSEREKRWIDQNDNKMLALIWSTKEALYKLPGMGGLSGIDMDVKPIEAISNSGNLDAIIRIGGTVQRFNYIRYNYVGSFNVVWVCCNPRTLVW
jgi:phosphopantetheinyl transferase